MKHDRISRCHFVLWITIQTLPLTEALLKLVDLEENISLLYLIKIGWKGIVKAQITKSLHFLWWKHSFLSLPAFLQTSLWQMLIKTCLLFYFLCCSLKCQRQSPWQHHCLSSAVGKCLVLNLFSVGGNHSVCKFVFINWVLLYPGCTPVIY